MIRNTTRNVARALRTAAPLTACATGGSYVQSYLYDNTTEQKKRTGRGAMIGTSVGVGHGMLRCNSANGRRINPLCSGDVGEMCRASQGN